MGGRSTAIRIAPTKAQWPALRQHRRHHHTAPQTPRLTLQRRPEGRDELREVEVLQRGQHVLRRHRLSLGVLAGVVGGGGEVVDEELARLAAGQQRVLQVEKATLAAAAA